MGRMTRTVNGSVASFKSPGTVPIRSLKAYFTPIQNGSGDPSPENVRPISGWNGITVYKGEENLFPADEYTRTHNGITFTYHSNGDIHIEGVSTGNAFLNVPTSMYFTIIPGTYTLSGNVQNSNVNIYVVVSNDNGGDIKFGVMNGGSLTTTKEIDFTDTQTRVQISVASGKTVNTTVHPCLKRGSEASKIESIPIELPNGTTVYGGYVDLITGDIVAEWGLLHYYGDSSEYWRIEGSDNFYIMTPSTFLRDTNSTSLICNMANSVPSLNLGGCRITRTGNFNIRIGSIINVDTVDDFKTWLSTNNIEVAVKFVTPIVIGTVSSTSIKTLIGHNCVWDSANGNVEVTYDLAESTDIAKRKHLFFNEPHDASALGDIASFETDMVSKLKSATFSFEPIQNGSGDPSPENVRPIVGWNSVDIYHTGINIFNGLLEDGVLDNDGYDKDRSGVRNVGYILIKPGQRYYVNFVRTNENIANMHVYLYDVNKVRFRDFWTSPGEIYSNDDRTCYLRFYMDSYYTAGTSREISINYPSTYTSYIPYNGQTIPIEFPVSGKNLLDPTERNDQFGNNIFYYRENHTSLKAGTYTISTSASGVSIYVYQYVDGQQTTLFVNYRVSSMTFTLENDTDNIGFNFYIGTGIDHTATCQLERGSTATAYEPYTTTIYGGYVDPIKGEVVAEWVKLPLKNRRWYNFSNFRIFGLNISKDKTTSILCDSTPIIVNRNPSADDTIGVYTNGTDYAGNIYYYKNAGFTTDEEFNTYINSLPYDPYIVFKTQTPIHYPIDQVNLKTFKGINNFWSSGNGETGIVYWTHK